MPTQGIRDADPPDMECRLQLRCFFLLVSLYSYNMRREKHQISPPRFGEEEEKEPKGYDQLIHRILKTRNILLSGEINKSLAERIIRQLILLEDENDEPIKFFIDSPGGDADAGFAILDMIRFIRPQIYTIGMGLVASAGAIILLAASKENRLSLPNSHYLIHQPLSGIRGVATEIEIHAKELDRIRTKINKLIADETGQTINKVEKDTDRDFWMNAEEALSYGLVSRIINKREEIENARPKQKKS